MFLEESLRIKEFIGRLDLRDGKVLDLGSSDKRFREHVQPYVDRNVFRPLLERGCQVQHLDLYGEKGVDLRLDLADLDKAQGRYDLVLCCNTLEHLPDPAKTAKGLLRLAKAGGHILITLPQVFPYHRDPQDSLLRPTVKELADLFPGAKIVESASLRGRSPYQTRGITMPLVALRILLAFRSLKYKMSGEKFSLIKDLKAVFGRWRVTYLVIAAEK